MGRPCWGGPRGISRGPLVVDGRRRGGGRGAWRGEVLPRFGEGRACLCRARPVACGRLLPRRGQRRRSPVDGDPGRRRAGGVDGRGHLRAVGRRDRRRHRVEEGSGPRRRERVAVRRGGRQRTEDLVPGRGPASGDLGRVGRCAGPGRRRDRRLGRPARDDPGRAAGAAGAGPGRAGRGGGDPALHLPGRGPAPASAPSGQRPGLGGRRVARYALGRGPGLDRGDQRDRARRGRHRPGVPGGARSTRADAGPGDQRDPRAGPVRGCVQCPDRADPPQRRPLRGRLACRAPRRGAWAAATRGVGPAGMGARPGPTRSSRRTAASWWPGGTTSCASSATATRQAPSALAGTRPGWIDREAAAELVVSILGAKRSAWNTADIRGKTEVLLAQTCLLADTAARAELAEDITARAAGRCVRLLPAPMCPSTSGP